MMTQFISLMAKTPTARRLLVQLLGVLALTATAATAAPVTLFQDNFEAPNNNNPNNWPSNWQVTPGNVSTGLFKTTASNGPSVAGVRCLTETAYYAKMTTTSTSWSAGPASALGQSYTVMFDYLLVAAGDQAQFFVASQSDMLNGYRFALNYAGGNTMYYNVQRVTGWGTASQYPGVTSVVTTGAADSGSATLASGTGFLGVWQTMTATITPFSDHTNIAVTWHGASNLTNYSLSFTDTNSLHLTSINTLGVAMHPNNGGPDRVLVDNFLVTIPEPAALTVLGAGLLFGLRRSRRAVTPRPG